MKTGSDILELKKAFKQVIESNCLKESIRNPHKHWWWLREDNTAYLRQIHPFSLAIDFFKSVSPKTVLNLGDGRGGGESVFFKNIGWKSLPCDDNTVVLEIAKNIGFIQDYSKQDAEELTFDNESFDYVITKETLHHLPRPYIAIYEMLRVAKEGICIIEPRDYEYKFGEEHYEPCGNFCFGFSLKELAKIFTGMYYSEVCYRYVCEVQPIIDSCGQCGGENFFKNKDKIQDEINKWYLSHAFGHGSLLMIFCFKQPLINKNRETLEKCGFRFLDIKRADKK